MRPSHVGTACYPRRRGGPLEPPPPRRGSATVDGMTTMCRQLYSGGGHLSPSHATPQSRRLPSPSAPPTNTALPTPPVRPPTPKPLARGTRPPYSAPPPPSLASVTGWFTGRPTAAGGGVAIRARSEEGAGLSGVMEGVRGVQPKRAHRGARSCSGGYESTVGRHVARGGLQSSLPLLLLPTCASLSLPRPLPLRIPLLSSVASLPASSVVAVSSSSLPD